MRYQKPETMELGVRAKKAAGVPELNCVPGAAAGAYESCLAGGAPWSAVPCVHGASTSAHKKGDCLSGTAVTYYCENGSGGNNDPYGCNTGISFA